MARKTNGRQTCGWCMTGHHEGCVPSIDHYGKIWRCQCPLCFVDLEIDDVEEEEDSDEATL